MDKLEMIFVVLVMTMFTIINGGAPGELHEVCQNENFQASCGSDEVILMEEARYGRMRLGRCVARNYGYLGCQIDILNIADTTCSGLHGCSIRVPNEMLDDARACPADLKSYFEAQYACLKVAMPSNGTCDEDDHVTLTEPQGTIASIVTMETGCGSIDSPWVIQVRPGQKIKVTLIDFASGSPHNNLTDRPVCFDYGYVKESRSKYSITVCGGDMRESHVFTSLENRVEVIIIGSGPVNTIRNFLLRYKAVGCPDPADIENGWFKREGNSIIVGCNNTEESMTALCNGTMWDHQLNYNCSSNEASSAVVKALFRFSLLFEIAIAMIFVSSPK